MFKYIFTRLTYFIPTLFLISVFTFALSKIAPGDPVELRMSGGMGSKGGNQKSDKLAGEKQYLQMKKKLGLDIPSFYFDFKSQSIPDTLYKITRKGDKDMLSGLIAQYGNWEDIQNYYLALKKFENSKFKVEKNKYSSSRKKKVNNYYNKIITTDEDVKIEKYLDKIAKIINKEETIEVDSLTTKTILPLMAMKTSFNELRASYKKVKTDKSIIKNWLPKFTWYGAKNQYHVWLFGNTSFMSKSDPNIKYGFFRGDFGTSYSDGRPVKSIIWDAVGITLKLNIISILLSVIIAIPLGIKLAKKKGSSFDRIVTIILFILYSLPSFWVATMFVVYLTTPEYGMDWFPTLGLHSENVTLESPFFTRFFDQLHHMALPVLAMTYGTFTYTSRQMRSSMLGVMKQDYIRTAVAKGLSEKTVTWKHTFRNSLIPIITMFASILPALIGGSMIIEIIFNISGMGLATFDAVMGRNYPIMFTVLMFSAILVMISMLLADLMYAAVDPRISFTNKKG